MNTMEWKGEPIAEPGMVVGMPLGTYHGKDATVGPSISSSGLRTIWNDSPAHYWAFSPYNPNRWERPSSEAMDLGSAAHFLLLEGLDGFLDRFAVRPAEFTDWRTKAAQAWRDEQRATGKIVITSDDLAKVNAMRASLVANPLVRAGILDGEVERSLFARVGGVWLRARPDVIPTASGLVADLKTTTSVKRDDLARTIAKFGYRIQASTVRLVFRELGIPFESMSLVFVETSPPFACRVVTLKDHELDLGEREARAALDMFVRGMETGEWPGPGGEQEDAEWIETPLFDQQRADERLRMLAEAQTSRTMEAAE